MSTLENSVIFDKGELITNDYFTGNAYLKCLSLKTLFTIVRLGTLRLNRELETTGINMTADKSYL